MLMCTLPKKHLRKSSTELLKYMYMVSKKALEVTRPFVQSYQQ